MCLTYRFAAILRSPLATPRRRPCVLTPREIWWGSITLSPPRTPVIPLRLRQQGAARAKLHLECTSRGVSCMRSSWSRPALRAALSRAALSRAASAAAQPKPPLKYFSAWFCPFAHRATLALEHHADVVPYAWEESLGWEQRPPTGKENFEAEEREDWWYHWFRRSPPIAPGGGIHSLSRALLPALAGNRQRC